MEYDVDVPVILGRPFMATAHALIDVAAVALASCNAIPPFKLALVLQLGKRVSEIENKLDGQSKLLEIIKKHISDNPDRHNRKGYMGNGNNELSFDNTSIKTPFDYTSIKTPTKVIDVLTAACSFYEKFESKSKLMRMRRWYLDSHIKFAKWNSNEKKSY
ncbi:hypothetical protein CCACVL1_11097 [Corchorus capsularis]|uniref:Uncharacterized protein n=1 Tax=Corchorus capsularis TaxID=210143 RepID=A0A1R3IMU6_COCAP|nr:hypothetical protein CCACVL1_11097 [Corchorus capsularis]